MTDQNSALLDPIRPDDLMSELGIKKDTYYSYLKHLGIKAAKDENGKSYLTDEQANLVRSLRSHVEKTGKIEGFPNSIESGLAWVEPADLLSDAVNQATQHSSHDVDCLDLEDLIYAAAELKGHQLVMGDLVKLELANRLTLSGAEISDGLNMRR
ncbi:MAG: hypothetical protein HC827_19265 [Cyanobacteria bacterium RM1_2_2]|nr:hypothetical protein [Cyanobacteria bacterium RM1_2_2]